MPDSSSRSAGATYLDRDALLSALEEAAERAAKNLPEIRRIVLFGSLVSGTATVASDADLLVEVASSPHAVARDRIPDMLGAFWPLPCPLDLVVLTRDELERARREGHALVRTALETGMDLISIE
jgi:predicted nucleotidyltransferase